MRRYEPGQEIIAGVKVVSHIGAGGFGTVYKVSVAGGIEKALKIINLQGTQGIKEFNALKLIKKISHPNLVPIDSYWLRDLQGRMIDFASDDSINAEKQSLELIILMGLGRMSLHDLLMQYTRQGKQGIPVSELIDLMTATAQAIDYLNEPHDLGLKSPVAIQHGDIKPGNILLVGNSVQVCDYGLAKAITSTKGAARTSIALFTPGYVAPEMNNNRPSAWSDQFSLAITYYELRTGRFPFNEEEEINAGIVAVLGKFDFSGVTRAEREVLERATNPIPDQRFPKCIDLVNALRGTTFNTARDSGPKPPTLEERIQPGSDVVPGYKLVERLSASDKDEFWKATTSAGKPFIIYIIREFRGALGNQLLQSLETLRNLEEHQNLINLCNCWTIHANGQVMPYVDIASVETETVALVALLDNVDCTLEDYYNECLRKRQAHGIPDHELLQFMMQAASVVDSLNELGYTEYLDLKPQTILLTKNKTVKLGIAGLAKRLMSGASSLTTDRLVNAFAPPELFDFEVGKHRNSNQYSLALTYYWLRSLGHLPFPLNSTPKQIREYHIQGRLDFSDVPEREQNILHNATVLDPNQRFSTCMEFMEAMQMAMGVSVPAGVGGGYASPIDIPGPPISRPTPQPPMYTGRRTDHDDPRQRVTPQDITKKKTPQKPDSRGTYDGTLDIGALPEDWQERYKDKINQDTSSKKGLLDKDYVDLEPEEETDLRKEVSEYTEAIKKKRGSSRTAITVVGLVLFVAIIGVVAYVVLNPPSPPPGGGGSAAKTSESDSGTKPRESSLETAISKINQLMIEEKYSEALAVIEKVNAQNDWKQSQKKNLSTALTGSLEKKLTLLKEAKKFEEAKKELEKNKTQFSSLIPPDFITGWETLLTPSPWPAKFANIKSRLKSLETPQMLADVQKELDEVKSGADAELQQEVQKLHGSITTLSTLSREELKNDPASLLQTMQQYVSWKKTADADLRASQCASVLPGKVVARARQAFAEVADEKTLSGWWPLFEEMAKENKDEWIEAGLLEGGLFDASQKANLEQHANKFNPSTGYGHYVKAGWLASSEALEAWKKAYPDDVKSWDPLVAKDFRKKLAGKKLNEMLDGCRVANSKRCVFSPEKEKQKLALRAIDQLLALQKDKPIDALLLAEKAILEDGVSANNQGKALKAFSASEHFKKLIPEYKDQIEQLLDVFPLDSSAPVTDRLRYITKQIKQLSLGSGDKIKIPSALVKEHLLPLAQNLGQLDIAGMAVEEKKAVATLCSDVGQDIALNVKSWQQHFDTDLEALLFSKKLLQIANKVRDHDVASTAMLVTLCRFNNITLEASDAELKALETAVEHSNELYSNLYLCVALNAKMELNAGNSDTHATYVSLLKDNEKQIDNTMKLLKDGDYYSKRFKCRLLIQKSNIYLRLANIATRDRKKDELLTKALSFANDAGTFSSYDKELLADMKGIILEDQALLLNKPTYQLAIKEYENALGDFGSQLRSKALLHKARCNYRLGLLMQKDSNLQQASKLYISSIKDMTTFLNDKTAKPLQQIEASYFRGLANLKLAIVNTVANQAMSSDQLRKGVADLNSALVISSKHSIQAFTNNCIQDLTDVVLAYAVEIKNKHENIYRNYSDDEDYKFCIGVLESLVNSLSERQDYVKYIRYRLVFFKNDINANNISNSEIKQMLNSAKELLTQCISASMERKNIILLAAVLEKSYNNSILAKDYESAYNYSKDMITSVFDSPYRDDFKALWNIRTARLAWYIYFRDQEGKKAAKQDTLRFLKQFVDNFHESIDSGHEELRKGSLIDFMKNVISNVEAEEKSKFIGELKELNENAAKSNNPNKLAKDLLRAVE